jgi:hypothetical protein
MALSAVKKKLESVPKKWGRSGNRKHTYILFWPYTHFPKKLIYDLSMGVAYLWVWLICGCGLPMGIYGILLSLNPVISLFFISSKNYID